MSNRTLHIDIAIIGGGIAGLWALSQLRNCGYSAVLFEREALGGYQTIGSQGIIHGGIKYALSGMLSGGSEAVFAMPDAWRACLSGRGKVDLRGTQLLSDNVCLWSGSGLSTRLSGLLASTMLRTRVQKLACENYPTPFQSPDFSGPVYRLEELVLDLPSLLRTLTGQHRGAIFSIDWDTATLRKDRGCAKLELPHCTVAPQCLLLTAGAGNAALIEALGSSAPQMQLRPLQQVLVKHQYPHPLFAHCLGNKPSPRLTVSSHRCRDGSPVWYLGGDLATEGAADSAQDIIERARKELHSLLPWIELGETEWRSLQLERAEPRQSTLLRPDKAFVAPLEGVENALVAWPTKLSLCPDLGDAIQAQLEAAHIRPQHHPDLSLLHSLGSPPVAVPIWDTLFP